MTETGTFVINGAERVIVSQLVRSPGIYYAIAHDKLVRDYFPAPSSRTEEHGWNTKLIPTISSMYVWTEPVRFRSLC